MKMTISLLQAYDWLKECPPHLKDSAKKQLIGQLNKEPFDNQAVARGQAYEDIICQALLTGQPVPPELERLRGMRQQAWLKGYTIKGYTFRGKMDFDDDDCIIDLKTTKKFSMQSYVNKKQHLVYSLSENKPAFTYLVACFPDETGLVPTRIHALDLTIDLRKAELDIYNAVSEFENWLKQEGLWDLYYDVFNGGKA